MVNHRRYGRGRRYNKKRKSSSLSSSTIGSTESSSNTTNASQFYNWRIRRELVRFLQDYHRECTQLYQKYCSSSNNNNSQDAGHDDASQISKSQVRKQRKRHVGICQEERVIGGYIFPALVSEVLVSQAYLVLPVIHSRKDRKIVHECCVECNLYHETNEQDQIVISIYVDGFKDVQTKRKKYHHHNTIKTLKGGVEGDGEVAGGEEEGDEEEDEEEDEPQPMRKLYSYSPWYCRRYESGHNISNDHHHNRAKDELHGIHAIDALIDQPGNCIRDNLDDLDYDQLEQFSLAHMTHPNENDNDDNTTTTTATWMLVDTAEKMRQCAAELHQLRPTELAFDLECYNVSKYTQLTCLLQITCGPKEYVIDPLAKCDDNDDGNHNNNVWDEIGPSLRPFFHNPAIVKIGHSVGGLDARCLHRDFGIFLINLFDTYEGAKVLNLPGHGLASVCEYYGLTNVEKYVTLKEQYQACDWTQRPLTGPMMQYGRYDIRYLIPIRKLMMRDLTQMELYFQDTSDSNATTDADVARSLAITLAKIQRAEDGGGVGEEEESEDATDSIADYNHHDLRFTFQNFHKDIQQHQHSIRSIDENQEYHEEWLKGIQLSVPSLSLKPLSGVDVMNRIQQNLKNVIHRYIRCARFFVTCQNQLLTAIDRNKNSTVVITAEQYYCDHIKALVEQFQADNTDMNVEVYNDLLQLERDAKDAIDRGCQPVMNAFLGDFEEGDAWGLRKWLSQHGKASSICSECEMIVDACSKVENAKDGSIQKLAALIRPKAKSTLNQLQRQIPQLYQEHSTETTTTSHLFLPFFHRLQAVLLNMSTLDPANHNVICVDDSSSSENEESDLNRIEESTEGAEQSQSIIPPPTIQEVSSTDTITNKKKTLTDETSAVPLENISPHETPTKPPRSESSTTLNEHFMTPYTSSSNLASLHDQAEKEKNDSNPQEDNNDTGDKFETPLACTDKINNKTATAAELRLQPRLMTVLSNSQERCKDIWSGKTEQHLQNSVFTALIARSKRKEIEFPAECIELYDELVQWRAKVANELKCLEGLVAPLAFLVFVAWKRPTHEAALRRIQLTLPPLLEFEPTRRADLLDIVKRKFADMPEDNSALYSFSEFQEAFSAEQEEERKQKRRGFEKSSDSWIAGKLLGAAVVFGVCAGVAIFVVRSRRR